jgi:hypothetical protein
MRFSVGLTAAGVSLAALQQPFEFLVVPAGPDNQRNSETDMLRLRGGRLMLARIDFHGPAGTDWANATISPMYSRDVEQRARQALSSNGCRPLRRRRDVEARAWYRYYARAQGFVTGNGSSS